MSYCRWSSMDFKCDLYVYESSDGIVIHVAGSRRDIPDELFPPPIADRPENPSEEDKAIHWDAWMERFCEVNTLVGSQEWPFLEIGGPYDGQTFTFSDHEEAAWWIEEKLAPLGMYIYPDDLVASLKADMEHIDAN